MKYISINSSLHQQFGFHSVKPFQFAAHSDFIPITVKEIQRLNGRYPLCFRKNANTQLFEFGLPAHVVVNESLLIHPFNGKFLLPYVPAVLRRYPFDLAKIPNGEYSMVVVENEPNFAKNNGEAIINAEGELSEKGLALQQFLVSLTKSFLKMSTALTVIDKLELFKPIRFTADQKSDVRFREDLLQIDEQKLNALKAEQLYELKASGALPMIYASLLSMPLLPRLSEMIRVHAKLQNDTTAKIDLQKMFDDDSDNLQFA